MVERKEKVKFKKIPKRKEVNNAERIRMNMLNCIRKVTRKKVKKLIKRKEVKNAERIRINRLNCIRKVTREKVKKLIKRKEVKNYKIRTNIFEIIKKKKGKIKTIPKRK